MRYIHLINSSRKVAISSESGRSYSVEKEVWKVLLTKLWEPPDTVIVLLRDYCSSTPYFLSHGGILLDAFFYFYCAGGACFFSYCQCVGKCWSCDGCDHCGSLLDVAGEDVCVESAWLRSDYGFRRFLGGRIPLYHSGQIFSPISLPWSVIWLPRFETKRLTNVNRCRRQAS